MIIFCKTTDLYNTLKMFCFKENILEIRTKRKCDVCQELQHILKADQYFFSPCNTSSPSFKKVKVELLFCFSWQYWLKSFLLERLSLFNGVFKSIFLNIMSRCRKLFEENNYSSNFVCQKIIFIPNKTSLLVTHIRQKLCSSSKS